MPVLTRVVDLLAPVREALVVSERLDDAEGLLHGHHGQGRPRADRDLRAESHGWKGNDGAVVSVPAQVMLRASWIAPEHLLEPVHVVDKGVWPLLHVRVDLAEDGARRRRNEVRVDEVGRDLGIDEEIKAQTNPVQCRVSWRS